MPQSKLASPKITPLNLQIFLDQFHALPTMKRWNLREVESWKQREMTTKKGSDG